MERKVLYDEVGRLRDELHRVAVGGCAHVDAHTTGLSTLHNRIDNEKRIRETDIREERTARIKDIEAGRTARENMERRLNDKMDSVRNQILVGIIVALTLAVMAGKFL